tara:strand:- start:157 stop:954 length:798 start_codon:yes stop_codon:yes gene_type:complete
MKIIVRFCWLTTLILFACQAPQEDAGPDIQTSSKASTKESLTEDECISTGYQVFKETVLMWKNSWQTAYPESGSRQTSFFTMDKLEELKNLDPERERVRIYYGMTDDEEETPTLLLVNISECTDLLDVGDNPVLVADEEGGHFITVDEAASMTRLWRNLISSKGPEFMPVLAYNYHWSMIEGLGHEGTPDTVFITLGLRSTAPGETLFASESYTHQGSIVYVNILHAANRVSASNHEFDFAMPCPQKCGKNSPLNTDESGTVTSE